MSWLSKAVKGVTKVVGKVAKVAAPVIGVAGMMGGIPGLGGTLGSVLGKGGWATKLLGTAGAAGAAGAAGTVGTAAKVGKAASLLSNVKKYAPLLAGYSMLKSSQNAGKQADYQVNQAGQLVDSAGNLIDQELQNYAGLAPVRESLLSSLTGTGSPSAGLLARFTDVPTPGAIGDKVRSAYDLSNTTTLEGLRRQRGASAALLAAKRGVPMSAEDASMLPSEQRWYDETSAKLGAQGELSALDAESAARAEGRGVASDVLSYLTGQTNALQSPISSLGGLAQTRLGLGDIYNQQADLSPMINAYLQYLAYRKRPTAASLLNG